MSAFQSGPAAVSSALARIRANRLCRLDALGRPATIPSTISMPAHCSSDQVSYSAAVICSRIHAGAMAVMALLPDIFERSDNPLDQV
ncbi:hypothetical protein [Nocardia sp. NPDC057272]|uniref:hypothetical protein n=1 Tax=Nocardia sp. NPDC057272 TaxID=3346079 RepID=UPI00363F13D0